MKSPKKRYSKWWWQMDGSSESQSINNWVPLLVFASSMALGLYVSKIYIK